MEGLGLGVSQVLVDLFSSMSIIIMMAVLNWCLQYKMRVNHFPDPRQTITEYQSPPVKQHSIERLNSSLSSGNPKNISIFDDTKKRRDLLTALLIEREIFWFDGCRYSAFGVPWQLPPSPSPSPGAASQVPSPLSPLSPLSPPSASHQPPEQEGTPCDLPGPLQLPPEVPPLLQTHRETASRWGVSSSEKLIIIITGHFFTAEIINGSQPSGGMNVTDQVPFQSFKDVELKM